MDSPILSSSILLENPEANFLLSLEPNELNEKENSENEKSNPKDMIEGLTSKIFDETTVKKSIIGNYLHTENFEEKSISNDFIYNTAIESICQNISLLKKKLNNYDLYKPARDMIYKAKKIETVIEQTYNYDRQLKEQMIEENYYLQKVIYSWRRVAGDGNCFYRSVIFAWLEYLVFNKKINVFKIIISNLYTKFDPNYVNTKRLPPNIRKYFISKERNIAIIILNIIIDILNDNQISDSKKIKNAYSILIKAFNFSTFDTTMIFYLRYILYEFILENEDKCFSKDFEVLLGNLLPQQYETEEGKFKFDNYFNEDLLKFYTCAEKLAVYLTPFVIKVDLKVIFYDFGKDCDIETKLFQSNLKNRDVIYVLFRKAHYDICYSQDYFNRFNEFLNLYKNFNDNCYILKENDIEKFKKKSNLFDIEGSRIFNRKLYYKKINEVKKEDKVENKIEMKIENKPEEIIDFSTRLAAMKNQIDSHESCFKCSKLIPKSDFNKFNIKFPCNCKLLFCNEECENNYLKEFGSLIENFPLLEKDYNINCPKCQKSFTLNELIEFSKSVNNQFLKESLKKKLKMLFNDYCMTCLCSLKNKKKYRIICKQDIMNDIIDEKKFIHYYCENCNEKKGSNCKICQNYHYKVVNKY